MLAERRLAGDVQTEDLPEQAWGNVVGTYDKDAAPTTSVSI